MTDSGKSTEDRLPLELERQIDAICGEFEAAWRAKQAPRIESYVKRVPRIARRAAMRELIAQEVDLRRSAGESVDCEEYRGRFQENWTEVEAAFELLSRRHPSGQAAEDTASFALSGEVGTDEDQRSRVSADDPGPLPERIGRYAIQGTLGKGAFGVVYLGHDVDLDRHVALKVPLASRFPSSAELEAYVQEARTAAQLKHPGIVTVYDVQRETDRVVIIQEYINGEDLSKAIKSGPFPPERAAELIVSIAGALAFAHQKGFVHRDLKPSNILLDRQGKPHVADFGLAIHESVQRQRRGERSGTPSYMSPEQVRGETNRLDGRTDIWSLGVILYEMLTGRRPFVGEDPEELYDEIKRRDPKPPCMIKPELPAEMERICLKCLSKRVADRYSNAAALAEDLRHWLSTRRPEALSDPKPTETKIVPKGLRSFGAEDADFFLELLPGPRDRNGLPESIRFWKTRIEDPDAGNTFSVGLIYGPSGCGKSSLVRAGLLPRLAPHVVPIYVESTPADTEVRLLKALRRRFPEVPSNVSLPEVFASLRRGAWSPVNQKVLIVLDQFEQCLHARQAEADTQLQQALRHCDGQRLQCVFLVRDDFWLATSRFMHSLEIELLEGRNMALVDLFDPLHARKVLAEFGQAYGRLPEDLVELTGDQETFLDRAVDGLAESGTVICVRLALLADMVKGRPWSAVTLRDVGGLDGLGVTFLEETFNTGTAPAQHRHHQWAAQTVLKALLPEVGADIKGGMRSREELLGASGYAERPNDFDSLIRILDAELRLITPTDPEGIESQSESAADAEAGAKYYQLTHDYLVPSLRDWLTRKLLDLDPALRRCDHHRGRTAPVDGDREIKLALDLAAALDVDRVHNAALRAGLVRHHGLAQHAGGGLRRFVGGADEYDAPRLAPATGMDLRFHDRQRRAELVERGGGPLGVTRGHAVWNDHSERSQDFLRLVFVDLHGVRADTVAIEQFGARPIYATLCRPPWTASSSTSRSEPSSRRAISSAIRTSPRHKSSQPASTYAWPPGATACAVVSCPRRRPSSTGSRRPRSTPLT